VLLDDFMEIDLEHAHFSVVGEEGKQVQQLLQWGCQPTI